MITAESAAVLAMAALRIAQDLERPIALLADDGGVPVGGIVCAVLDGEGVAPVPAELIDRAVRVLLASDRIVLVGEGAAAVLKPGMRCGFAWES